MSTKTTFKRVALVAVASLGFGALSVVAPSTASAAESTSAMVGTVSITTPATGRVGNPLSSTVKILAATGVDSIANNDTISLRAIFISKPATSTAAVGFTAGGAESSWFDGHVVRAAGAASNELLPAFMSADAAQGIDETDLARSIGSVGFIPDVVGSYIVRVWHDVNANGLVDSTEDRATDTTFIVGSPVAGVTVTNLTGASEAGGSNGAIVRLTLVDAAGALAGLAGNESLTIVTPATAAVKAINGVDTSAADGADTTLTAANFIESVAYLNLKNSSEAVISYTITSTGMATPVTSVFTVSYWTDDVASDTGSTVLQGATAGAVFTSITSGINGADSTSVTIPVATRTLTYYTSGTTGFATGDYAAATVTDLNGFVTGSQVHGVTGLVYDATYQLTEIAAASTTIAGTLSITLTAPDADALGFNATFRAGASDLTSQVRTAATLTGTATVTPAATTPLNVKLGGSVTYVVRVLDQFGRAIPNLTVTRSGGTRNVTPVGAPTAVTDATGRASFTITDAGTSTVNFTDTYTFTPTGVTAVAGGAITWTATGPVVGTVTVLGGDNGTTTGVADATPTVRDIAAGNGAQAGVNTFTATVRDASGNLLVGVPVTFTVSGTTAAVLSTTVTSMTGAAGTASASVYAWAQGKYTVTATAGDKTGTAGLTVAQLTATEARAISATVSGTIVTAKVVDRFGNDVPGVTVYATKTGPGFFGAGVTSTSAVTNTAGIAEFVIAGGDAEVTVSTLDPNAAAGTLAFGQTCAKAGFVSCAATATALTAATVGTPFVAEVGIGASLSAAGVSSAKVTVTGDSSAQAAADAAAEATDAANAATDAANAAAEAADAATAAAQDAADAVAALSTQVTELVSALRKQITSLTNLVIKIQKKVRA
jgi:hypothetical protein